MRISLIGRASRNDLLNNNHVKTKEETMTNKKTIETDKLPHTQYRPDFYIKGEFILSEHIDEEMNRSYWDIKLSDIEKINVTSNYKDIDFCCFYTKGDLMYFVPIHANQLRKILNRFFFEPEKHWELYPDQ